MERMPADYDVAPMTKPPLDKGKVLDALFVANLRLNLGIDLDSQAVAEELFGASDEAFFNNLRKLAQAHQLDVGRFFNQLGIDPELYS